MQKQTNTLLMVNPDFVLPETFSELKALYWANQRIIDALYDVGASDRCREGRTVFSDLADFDTTADKLYSVQELIFQAILAMPVPADRSKRGARAEVLVHYKCQVGLASDPSPEMVEMAERLASYGEPTVAAFAIAAE